MIISFFGADGVGKSTIIEKLADSGYVVFSGTDVASWPEQTWINELTAQGIDEPSYDNDNHFLEKIRRAHTLARKLERLRGTVVIDSDPFHKTLMHDYLRALPDKTRAAAFDRYQQFYELAGLDNSPSFLHVLAVLRKDINTAQQAETLLERVNSRDSIKYFDPSDLVGAINRIEASSALAGCLKAKGQNVLTLETLDRFEPADFIARISGAAPLNK